MANKYSFEMSLDTKGYTDGAKAAEDANADFVSSLGKTNRELPNLRKELGAARKEVSSLALAYAKLSNTEKNSAFGKQLKKQLDEAKQKTAELIDLNGDLTQELKNMASDTAAWDAMKEGLGVGKDAMTALVSLTADLTGNEADLAKMIQKIAQVQSIANTAITVGNAVQKQSALMNGVRRVQELALSKAIQLETSSTVGATIAQKAFNIVAKANPYVLLGTAALALVGALVTYISVTNKSISATEKLKKEMHETSLQGQKDAQNDITQLDLLYKATQNTKLSIDERRKATEELQDMYPSYFGNLSTEEILVGKASKAYQQLKDDIIAVAMARAYQDKITEKAKENVDLEDQLKDAQKKLDKFKKERDKQNGIVPGGYSGAATSGELFNLQSLENEISNLKNQITENKTAMSGYQDKINETAPATERLTNASKGLAGSIEDIEDKISKLKTRANKGLISKEDFNKQIGELQKQLETAKKGFNFDDKKTSGTTKQVKIEVVSDSIGDLEKKISDLQERAKKGVLPDDLKDPEKYKARLASLQSELKELKIKWGFEEPETKLQKLQKALDTAQKAYVIAVTVDDANAAQAALMAYYSIQKELDDHKAKIKIDPIADPKEIKKQLDEINNLVNDTYKANIDFKFDFSSLPEATKKEAEAALEQFEKIRDARQRLNDIIENKDNKYNQEAIDAAREKIVLLTGSYNELIAKLNEYSIENNTFKKMSDDVNLAGEALQNFGSVMSSVGNVFKSIGDDATATAMQIISSTSNMIAQVVPQIMKLIGVKQAESMAAGTASAAHLPFPANLGAIASIISTILSVFAQIKSAGQYATGGTVGGSSYYGDKLMAYVNSGETILTRDQTKNVVNSLDNNKLDRQIIVMGETKLKGSDIYIALRNYDGVQSKLGKNIGIR